jgi:hypothetical protein
VARGDNNQVVYVAGDIPQLPLQLGQLLVDSSLVSPGNTNLQQCTSQSPVTYAPIQGGYPITPGEVTAGVVVVNDLYPPGYWDRYGNNTTPGTTDMAPAASAAYAVAKQGGCSVRWGATAPYRLNSPVNCTQMRGIVSWDESSKQQATAVPSIIIAHQGQTYSHGFDLSASTAMTFNNVVPTSLAGMVPNCVFFMARDAAGSGAGGHRFYNTQTPSNCTFAAIFYAYGSEENVYSDGFLYNNQAGSRIKYINCTNPSGYTSAFLTIATGAQSNASHSIRDTQMYNLGNSGSANESCLEMERANNLTWQGGLAYCPNGLAYVAVTGTIGSTFLSLNDIRGETDGSASTVAALAVRTSAATGADSHFLWTIKNCNFATVGSGYFLDCNSTSDIIALSTRNVYSQSGNNLLVHGLSYSILEHLQQNVVSSAGGDVSNCMFVGSRSAVTFGGTASLNIHQDTVLGQSVATGFVATAGTPTGTGSQVSVGNTVRTTVGGAGGASALPATPRGYLEIDIGGTKRQLPYYDVP